MKNDLFLSKENRYILFLAVIILFTFVCFIIYFLTRTSNQSSLLPSEKKVISPTHFYQSKITLTPVTPERIIINKISIKNFFNSPNPDLNRSYEVFTNNEYKITFNPQNNNQFFITVASSPFLVKRQEVENILLEILDIDQKTACGLFVQIITSPKFNPGFGGKYYPLSFCENAKE